jgi:hypothetical protein
MAPRRAGANSRAARLNSPVSSPPAPSPIPDIDSSLSTGNPKHPQAQRVLQQPPTMATRLHTPVSSITSGLYATLMNHQPTLPTPPPMQDVFPKSLTVPLQTLSVLLPAAPRKARSAKFQTRRVTTPAPASGIPVTPVNRRAGSVAPAVRSAVAEHA